MRNSPCVILLQALHVKSLILSLTVCILNMQTRHSDQRLSEPSANGSYFQASGSFALRTTSRQGELFCTNGPKNTAEGLVVKRAETQWEKEAGDPGNIQLKANAVVNCSYTHTNTVRGGFQHRDTLRIRGNGHKRSSYIKAASLSLKLDVFIFSG